MKENETFSCLLVVMHQTLSQPAVCEVQIMIFHLVITYSSTSGGCFRLNGCLRNTLMLCIAAGCLCHVCSGRLFQTFVHRPLC